MIHHLSISAHDPKHVAGVLAELMSGEQPVVEASAFRPDRF